MLSTIDPLSYTIYCTVTKVYALFKMDVDKVHAVLEMGQSVSQSHGMYCHDLEVMSSNPDRVELGVRRTSVLSRT